MTETDYKKLYELEMAARQEIQKRADAEAKRAYAAEKRAQDAEQHADEAEKKLSVMQQKNADVH
ncbi:MAG: hypothetical protein QOG91_412 [Candidatus Parcubacteria bacterium]|jgi:hypothetical protein|nr:hypothetical protein [Candidatus Parcubacteria bacterium]